MTPDTFKRVLAWSPKDEQLRADLVLDAHLHGKGAWIPQRPAPWPEIMTAQRLAWHHGADEAYARLYGPKARAA